MAGFRNTTMDANSLTGMGGYGLANLGRKPGELSPGTRKNVGMPPQPSQTSQPPPLTQPSKTRKTGLFDDDDASSETSMYLQNSMNPNLFRQDRDMMPSQSPSQLGGFGSSNFYNQGLNNYAMQQQQRGVFGPQFRGSSQGHVTPTSMNPNSNVNFPMNLQQPPQQPSPNRSVISAIGGQRAALNQGQGSAVSNLQKRTLAGMGAAAGLSSLANNFGLGQSSRQILSDDSQSGLDLSEFPTLGNRGSLPSNPITPARNYVGIASKPVSDQTPEFQIQQEDFPALPGAQNPVPTSDPSRKTPTSAASGTYEQAVSKDAMKVVSGTKRGIQTHADGTVSNIPSGMVNDQFGIVGLLTFIRAGEIDPNLVALAPGIDLTTLGLSLNSPENLYSTFQSPWVDIPCRPQDIDFHVPQEYLTNIYTRDKLAPIKLNRYQEDLLFFLFYMNGGDLLQRAAALELYNRDWRYHKEERLWLTREPGMDPVLKARDYEKGTYYFFDSTTWRKVPKEFFLEYEKLEDRPILPSSFHQTTQTAAQ